MAAGTYVEQIEGELGAGAGGSRCGARAPSPVQRSEAPQDDETEFDPAAFDFGGHHEIRAESSAQENSAEEFDPAQLSGEAVEPSVEAMPAEAPVEGFRTPGGAANTAEILKFLIDRTGYIKVLEEEDSPEAFSRVENIRELVNAAMDSKDRGETLDQFLDHAALVSDADAYDERAQITLMTLHAAKGLEFPLVFLCGHEEGLFPHSRTFLNPDDIEEERRLCYVGMTRAMDQLVITRAVYRRRYGTDMPEASVPSRFLEEVPAELMEDLGTARRQTGHYPVSKVAKRWARQRSGVSRQTGRTGMSDPHGQHYSLRRRRPICRVEGTAAAAGQSPKVQLHRQHC